MHRGCSAGLVTDATGIPECHPDPPQLQKLSAPHRAPNRNGEEKAEEKGQSKGDCTRRCIVADFSCLSQGEWSPYPSVNEASSSDWVITQTSKRQPISPNIGRVITSWPLQASFCLCLSLGHIVSFDKTSQAHMKQ